MAELDREFATLRQVWLLAIPAAGAAAYLSPDAQTITAITGLAGLAVVKTQQRLSRRRFHREYIAPTLEAVEPPLGMTDGGVTLHVDPSLGNLTPRLARPLSPAEERTRLFYGERVEPVLRWLPEHVQRGAWAVQRWARPVTGHLQLFRRPGEQLGPRIELVVRKPYLTAEQRLLVSSIINSKIPVADLVEAWHQVGPKVTARWTVRKRPPASVGYDDVLEHMPKLKEWEFYVGQGVGDQPVTISLHDD
jgi:hypothetical protein